MDARRGAVYKKDACGMVDAGRCRLASRPDRRRKEITCHFPNAANNCDGRLTPVFVLRRPAAAAVLLPLIGCNATLPTAGDTDLALYRRVMDRVHSSYVEPVNDDRMMKDSLKGMLTGLDPHSDYMDEDEYREMLADSHGEFAGIGTELTRDESHPKIISPIDDTPAARASLKPVDVILRIDRHPTDGMSLKDTADQRRAPAGTKVRLLILPLGQL